MSDLWETMDMLNAQLAAVERVLLQQFKGISAHASMYPVQPGCLGFDGKRLLFGTQRRTIAEASMRERLDAAKLIGHLGRALFEEAVKMTEEAQAAVDRVSDWLGDRAEAGTLHKVLKDDP